MACTSRRRRVGRLQSLPQNFSCQACLVLDGSAAIMLRGFKIVDLIAEQSAQGSGVAKIAGWHANS